MIKAGKLPNLLDRFKAENSRERIDLEPQFDASDEEDNGKHCDLVQHFYDGRHYIASTVNKRSTLDKT